MNLALLQSTTGPRYSIGALVGIPITILVAAVALVVLILAVRHTRHKGWRSGADAESAATGVMVAGGALIVLVATAAIFIPTWWPFDWSYHQWQPVRGEVAQIDKRLVGDRNSGMSEMFVVKFDGAPDEYRCDDSRCAAVHSGDVLELTCKRKWQWSGTHGRECNFVAAEAKAR